MNNTDKIFPLIAILGSDRINFGLDLCDYVCWGDAISGCNITSGDNKLRFSRTKILFQYGADGNHIAISFDDDNNR